MDWIIKLQNWQFYMGFPGGSVGKESACNVCRLMSSWLSTLLYGQPRITDTPNTHNYLTWLGSWGHHSRSSVDPDGSCFSFPFEDFPHLAHYHSFKQDSCQYSYWLQCPQKQFFQYSGFSRFFWPFLFFHLKCPIPLSCLQHWSSSFYFWNTTLFWFLYSSLDKCIQYPLLVSVSQLTSICGVPQNLVFGFLFFFTYALASLLSIFSVISHYSYSQVQNSQPSLRRLCLETRLLLIFSLEGIIAYHTPSIIPFKAVPPQCHTFFCLCVPTHWLPIRGMFFLMLDLAYVTPESSA